jgi:putative aldouronate transport system substrate-binding protein
MVLMAATIVGCATKNGNAANTSQPGTNASQPAQSAPPAAKVDISKKVEVSIFVWGNAPRDLQPVTDALNQMTLKDLNCTIQFQFAGSDAENRYNLALTSGQPLDIIYTALWRDYPKYAKLGAFLPLEDKLQSITPELYASIDADGWKSTLVDGHIYTVPAPFKEYNTKGMLYREDLRKKYNLPEIKDLDSMYQYLVGIKQNETTLVPTTNYKDIQVFADVTMPGMNCPGNADYARLETPYMFFPDGKNREINNYLDDTRYIDRFKEIKKWADAGIWSRDVLNYKGNENDDLLNGVCAAALNDQPAKAKDAIEKTTASHPDWELKYFSYAELGEPVHPNPFCYNGLGLPKAAANPDRALMFIEKLHISQDYYDLTQYGIKGTHWEPNDKGEYRPLIAPDKSGFNNGALQPWGWFNDSLMRQTENGWNEGWADMNKYLDSKATPGFHMLFTFDVTNLSAEDAAIKQVDNQYLVQLNAGLVDDVEQAWAEYKSKLNAAGIVKYQEEFKTQWLAMCDQLGLQ